MTNFRQGALSELARQGFNDLSGALADLDKLVELLGDSARPSTHYLSQGADPDSALKFTVLLAETESKRLKKVISNEISATAY